MSALPAYLQPGGFRRLLVGQAASAFGDWMATIALMALVHEITGSAAAVGGVLALRLMPAALAGPLATSAALKLDRRRTMLAMDLVRTALVVVIPLVSTLWWVYTFAFLTELANLVFLPARDASVPDLVDDRDLPAANGLLLVSSYGNIPLGAAAFAGVFAASGALGGPIADHPYVVVFVIDALTYLVSYALIRTVEIPEAETAGATPDEDVTAIRLFARAFRLPLLRQTLPGLTTVLLGAGALFSLGVVYVEQVLGATTREFGFLIAIFGVGAGGAAVWLQRRERVTATIVRAGVVGMGVVLAAMSLVSTLGIAYLVATAFGAFAATALIAGITYLQQQLQGRDRVLGFTAFHVTLRVGMSVGALGAGFAAEQVSPVTWPVVDEVPPTALVMFFAGLLVLAGGLTVRGADPETSPSASHEPATKVTP